MNIPKQQIINEHVDGRVRIVSLVPSKESSPPLCKGKICECIWAIL